MDLHLHGITKHYGRTLAVGDVSFTCARGEFFSILGASGAGKSTLLKSVAGIIQPDSELQLFGEKRRKDSQACCQAPPG